MASPRRSRSKVPLPKGFGALWSTVALDLVGFGMVIPILGVYATDFGASGFEVGLLVAAYSAAQFLFSPVWGRLSDRIGRRPVLVISLVGSALGSLLTGLAPTLIWLYLGRIVDGASGASVAVAQASATDLADESERPRLMGLLGAAFALGFVLGPALGGLAGLVNRRLPFYIAAALAAVNAVAAWIRVPETNPRHLASKRPVIARRELFRGTLAQLVVVAFLAISAFSGFEATFAILTEDRFGWTQATISGVFVVVGLVLAAVQGGLIGHLSKAHGSARVLAGGLVLLTSGMVVIGLTDSVGGLAAGLVLLVSGQGLVSPSMSTLVSVAAPDHSRGAALGVQQSGGALARIVGPVLAGAVYHYASPTATYLVAAALGATALALFSRPGGPLSELDRTPGYPVHVTDG